MQTLRRSKNLTVENLESRVNLSTAAGAAALSALGTTHFPQMSYLSRMLGAKRIDLGVQAEPFRMLVGDTNVGTTASVTLTDYSAISGCALETRASGQDIGWMSTSGAYVDYRLNVQTAGNYNIYLSTASTSNATADLYVSGMKSASYALGSTGSWDSYHTTAQTVYLPAGTSTIRIQSTNGSQYNINGVQIAQQGAPQPTGGTISVSSNTTLPLAQYASISGWKLETRTSGQDLGYMSTSGASVSYQLSVQTVGNYAVNLSTASTSNGSADLYVNGTKAASYSLSATGSWDTYRSSGQVVYLPAGASTLKIQSTNGCQFNLNGIQLVLGGTTTTTTNATVSIGSNTTIPLGQYSAISGCKLETRSSGQDIGYVSTSGASVQYNLNVASGGTYNLNIGFASGSGATADVYVNGNKVGTYSIPSTGSWDSYTTLSKQITLSAGANTLRIQSVNGTQYNMNSVNLSQGTAPTTTTTTTTTSPVSVSTQWMTSFTQLNITGSSGNDSIYVKQSGSTVYINNVAYTGNYGNIVIKGVSGNDTITVDSSVQIDTRVYAGINSSDTIQNYTRGHATIVAIGNGYDKLTGNGFNTSFWADPGDTVNASSTEWNAGRVHQVSSFYAGISTQLAGQNLSDPAGTGSTVRLTSNSLWGTGPSVYDVNQGQSADCFVMAPVQSMASQSPERLRETAVDLGDGTYAVQFVRNGSRQFVRVDGDLPAGGAYANGLNYAHPGSSGNLWAPIIEKAYAIFRTGAWNYSSLNTGWIADMFSDLGVANTGFGVSGADPNTLYNTLQSATSSGRAVAVGSITGAPWPIIGYHAYSVTSVSQDGYGNKYITVRNPWGMDGVNFDSNPGDGYLTISMAQFQSAFGTGVMAL